jgi:long-chain acyl-CoA synthetase
MYQIPENTPSYTDLLRNSLAEHASLPCFHVKRDNEWQTWTYEDFHNSINRITDALRKNGFKDKDNGIVIGENSPEWVVMYHSYFIAGGCTVPVDPNIPASELQEIIKVTGASFIACTKSHADLLVRLKPEMPTVKKIILLDIEKIKNTTTFKDFSSMGSVKFNAMDRKFGPQESHVIIFTSGTTGKAKGVVLNQGTFVSTPLHAAPRMKINSNDTMLALLPLNHVFGAGACIAAAMSVGIDLVFVNELKAPVILEAIREKHVTILPAVPKMITLFYNSIERTVKSRGIIVQSIFSAFRLLAFTLGPVFGKNFRKKLFSSVHATFGGKLNLMISGGASLQKKHFNAFINMGFTIVEGYGLTETFGPITLCPGDRPKLSSVGPVITGNEIRICNPDASGVGEVLFRGLSVFTHYYKNPEKTDDVFDKDGWFHTGDLGKIDKDGYLFICGRIKDIIVLESGKNAYPEELEDYYLKSDMIEEIGVFGVNVKDKEIIAALIVPSASVRNENTPEKASEIIYNEIVRMGRNLPSYKKLTDFRVVYDPLPRTTTQKLKKHELRKIYMSHGEGPERISPVTRSISSHDKALLSTREYIELTRQIISLFNFSRHRQILPSNNLEIDIGLDSLKRVELFCRLEEKFYIIFPEETLFQIQTVGDLYTLIMELKTNASENDSYSSQQTLRQRLTSATIDDMPVPQRGNILTETVPGLTFALSKLLWNLSIDGVIDEKPGRPLIFCSNHQSYLDILWLMHSLPESVRENTYITGKSELLDSVVLAPFLKNAAFIPIDREGDIINAIRQSIAVLRRGKNIVIFPEGQRSRTGAMNTFKGGIGMLMLETNAAVVPVRIKGAYDIWPAGKIPKILSGRRFKPSITFGEKFTLQKLISLGRLSPYSSEEQVAACIQDIIEKM